MKPYLIGQKTSREWKRLIESYHTREVISFKEIASALIKIELIDQFMIETNSQ